MERKEAEDIMIYYSKIPDMLNTFCRERNSLEDAYYNGARAMDMDGMPHGSSVGSSTERMAIKAAEDDAHDILVEVETRITVLQNDKRQIRGSIDCLNNRYKTLLLDRFVNEYSWTKLAAKMHASESTVRYWKEKALDQLGFVMEDEPMVEELAERASRAR